MAIGPGYTMQKKVAAASSFEPDFVFPLENVTVAQGRDGLYLNKSNKIVIFGIAAVSNRDRYYSLLFFGAKLK